MGSNAIQCKGGSENIEIRWNRFHNGGSRAINIGGSTGFQFFRPPLSANQPNVESRDIRVEANVFEGGQTPVAFVGTVGSVVANNTIINPRRWLLRILQETVSNQRYEFLPCGGNVFVNNLVYFDNGLLSTPLNIGSNTAPNTFGFSHNLWYAHDRPARSQPRLPSAETNGIVGLDPQLRNVDARDWSIPTASPATAKGVAWPGVKADMLDRCYAAKPSIGAFEPQSAPAD
jgi:hypothetical protein